MTNVKLNRFQEIEKTELAINFKKSFEYIITFTSAIFVTLKKVKPPFSTLS